MKKTYIITGTILIIVLVIAVGVVVQNKKENVVNTTVESEVKKEEVVNTIGKEVEKITQNSVLNDIRDGSVIVGELQRSGLTEEEYLLISPTDGHSRHNISYNGKYILDIIHRDGSTWDPQGLSILNTENKKMYKVNVGNFKFGNQIVNPEFSKDENYILLFNQSEAEGVSNGKFKIIVKN
jgi:hypothetical protein